MDRKGFQMDIINRREASQLLSRQVTGGRYFFFNLAPRRRGPLALVMGGREHCNPDYAISRRNFPFFCLEFVVSGRGSVELDGRRHELVPGVMFTYAPTTRYEIHNDPAHPMLKYFLSFAGTEAPRRLKRCGVAPGQVRQLAARAEITSVLEDLVREGQ